MKLSTKEHSVKLKITKCRRGGSLRPPKNFLQINGRALKTLPYKKIIFSNTAHRPLCSPTPESICNRVTSKVKNGSIVLFHNDADHTPAALPNILKTLLDQGYEFVFIEDLIYKENYEIIHDGTQCKISE